MRLTKSLLVFALLALAGMATATSLTERTELAIADFKAKFNSLFNVGDDGSCSYKGDGASFNWSSMKGKTFDGTDPTDNNHYSYKLTMCGLSPDAQCAADNQGSLCQYDITQGNKYVSSLASFIKAPAPTFALIKPNDPSGGVEATFVNGGSCGPAWNPMDRTVKLRLTCGQKTTFQVDEIQDCVYIVEFANKATCGGGSDDGLSGGSIFLIILMVSAFLYVAIGCGICYKRYEKRGLDACPQKDFWFALPGLVKDGVVFSIGKIRNLFGSKTITTSAGEYESA